MIFLLTRNTQILHAELVGQCDAVQRCAGTSSTWRRSGTSRRRSDAAALNAEVTRQANIVAYADDFKLMMLVSLVALPLIFLLKRAKVQPGETAILE